MEDGGFTLVTRQRKRKKGRLEKSKAAATDLLSSDEIRFDIKALVCNVKQKDGKFCSFLQNVITSEGVQEIVCYGIGKIASCKIAQHQLAVLLTLTQNSDKLVKSCSVYDPVLGETERKLIREEGLLTGDENDGCRRQVTAKTLFYMIHCSKEMYDNVLAANRTNLENCLILGNSLQGYLTHNTNAALKEEVPDLFEVAQISTEERLPPFESFPNVFNDTFLIRFPADHQQKHSTKCI